MPPVRRLTAILAADVAGYSRLMGQDEEGAVVENQDVAWIATLRRRTTADVDYDVAGDALVRPEDEDALGVRRGELAAAGYQARARARTRAGRPKFPGVETLVGEP
jgi:hypothetical protein